MTAGRCEGVRVDECLSRSCAFLMSLMPPRWCQHAAWVSRITFTHKAPSPHTNTYPHLFITYKYPSITYSWENWYALSDTFQSKSWLLKVYTVLDGPDKGQAYLYWWMPFETCCQSDYWYVVNVTWPGRWTDYPKQKDRVTRHSTTVRT